MGRRPRISRSQILEVAMQVVEADGIDRLTMRSIAERLDVTTMAIYRHLADKDAVLDGIVEQLLVQTIHDEPAAPWDDRLLGMLTALHQVVAANPRASALLLQRPAATDLAASLRQRIYDALIEGGVAPEQVVVVERFVSTLAIGHATSLAAGRFTGHGPAGATLDDLDDLERFLRAGIDAFRQPGSDVTDAPSATGQAAPTNG